jgi:energy-coupling factor transport system ATP-binding protein
MVERLDASEEAPLIRLRDVTFTYRDAATPALCGVSLDLRRGEFVVLMGATGAGKSTLAKCLNRTVPAFQSGQLDGEVCVLGRRLSTEGVGDLAGVVGLVSQDFEAQLFATNVAQEVAFGMEMLGVAAAEMQARVRSALDLVGLRGFESRDPATLSGGEKQRLAIASVLALQPQVLVFDEPTTDLDPLGKLEIFDVLANLRRAGYAILLVEHEIAAAERADRLLLMAHGRIVAAGAPAELLGDVDRLEGLGVRASDLDRLAARLGWQRRVESIDEAVQLLGPALHFAPAADAGTGAEGGDGEEILSAREVTYRYEEGRLAVHSASLRVRRGEFIALIGQNGSGKTTLARLLNGLLTPSAGAVQLRGKDLRQMSLNRIAREVGYVFQNPDHQIFAASVREEVSFALRNFGIDEGETALRVRAALQTVGLLGLEDEDPFLFGKGQRQRLAVASLLALRPDVLILDEPTTGLDYPEQRRMMDLLRELHHQGMTLLVITHSPWVVAEYAERGVLLRGGEVMFDGPLRELFAREALLEQCHFRVPDITRLSRRYGRTALSVDEVADAASGARGGAG